MGVVIELLPSFIGWGGRWNRPSFVAQRVWCVSGGMKVG